MRPAASRLPACLPGATLPCPASPCCSKTIRTHAVVNTLVNDKTLLKQYRQRIAELQAQIGSYAAAAAAAGGAGAPAAAVAAAPSSSGPAPLDAAATPEAAVAAASAERLLAANAEIQQSRDRAAQLERTVARLQV